MDIDKCMLIDIIRVIIELNNKFNQLYGKDNYLEIYYQNLHSSEYINFSDDNEENDKENNNFSNFS